MRPIREWKAEGREAFEREILSAGEPVVMRGLVRDWPAVRAAEQSPQAFAAYLKGFDRGAPARHIIGPPEIEGRFFYAPDMKAFNFRRGVAPLGETLDYLLSIAADPRPPALAMQSALARETAPGFEAENRLDLAPDAVEPRLWLGNRVKVVAHYDNADNLACVVAGRRRFTLFPPDQIGALYPGPIEFTPAGTVISLVDMDAPDLERFPRFPEALAAARTAELEPGDVLYIPFLWWHDVRSLSPLNLLVNYWWSPLPAGRCEPRDALLAAILSIRALPDPQRQAWRALLDHYIFERGGPAADHIPEAVRGVLGDMDAEMLKAVRASLAQALRPI